MKKTLKRYIALALSLCLIGTFFMSCKEQTVGEKATYYIMGRYDLALSTDYYEYAYNDEDKLFNDIFVMVDVPDTLHYIDDMGVVAAGFDDDERPWCLVFTRNNVVSPYQSVEHNKVLAGGQYAGAVDGIPVLLVMEYYANYTDSVKETALLNPEVDKAVETKGTTDYENSDQDEEYDLMMSLFQKYESVSGFGHSSFVEDKSNVGKKISIYVTPEEIESSEEYGTFSVCQNGEYASALWFCVFSENEDEDFSDVVDKSCMLCGEYKGFGGQGLPELEVWEYYIGESEKIKSTAFFDSSESFESSETSTAEIPEENKDAYMTYTDFQTQSYSGNGDDVIYIETPTDRTLYVLYIKGNDEGGYFGVTGYTGQRDYTELFANTTSPYEGIVFDVSQKTRILEIQADGEWTIEVRSIMSCPIVKKGMEYSGSGDQVLLVTDSPDTADITGNSGENYFGVRGYGKNGYDLLVNTTKSYNGTVLIDPSTACIAVTAVGEWKIKLN